MTIEQFQELAPKTVNNLMLHIPDEVEAVIRTLHPQQSNDFFASVSRHGHRFDVAHMATGMQGEALTELMMAIIKENLENTLEEATDIKWYIVVYAGWKGIRLDTQKLKMWKIQNSEKELAPSYPLLVNLCVGTLADVLKRESCYGVAKYQKKEVTPEVLETLIYDALASVDVMLYSCNLDPQLGYDMVIEKLHKVRYKDGFTTEAATNRDLDAESKVVSNSPIENIMSEEENAKWYTTSPESDKPGIGGQTFGGVVVEMYEPTVFDKIVEETFKPSDDDNIHLGLGLSFESDPFGSSGDFGGGGAGGSYGDGSSNGDDE